METCRSVLRLPRQCPSLRPFFAPSAPRVNFGGDPESRVNLCQNTRSLKSVTCAIAKQPTAIETGSNQTMVSRPGPSPLTDQQIQSAVSRLLDFYLRNRKTISRAGWLILLVSLGNRVRVAVDDQRKPRRVAPTATSTTTIKKHKAEVLTHFIIQTLMID